MVIIDRSTKLQCCCCISTVRMNPQDLPPLPRIEDTELFMTVYTHHTSFPPTYHPPASSMTSTSGAPPNLSWLTLSVVNQAAAQKRMRIHYQGTRVGEDHSPTWTVRCFINDQERGVGTGKTQKLAKEEAARKAYIDMGWMQ
ncbi:hypothetical protein DFJ43DRAFT_854472 [Lentinula guzmanii]|uniref:DRBM domain-containing protein n=3 Tax=Lentinula TaxID=5352 RepID=A0AA38MV37_9AGAR|nr:hypothetical protein DFJ43DRAFT_854472 [Lentinula guzmanii]KAJ3785606.1 hypothetical protein GGU10DRAFT_354205 [Lentinula aff. detonsa]KAJ3794891.1 hypothetical protein GGU11DRAFT_268571 [Lentinula aff. detonsa]KAJ3990119.1 hypothetical protein F5890DRAFT_696991 [Lentinula detonsa]